MSVEPEQGPKPKAKRKPVPERIANDVLEHESLANTLPADRDEAARKIALAVEDQRSSLDNLSETVEFALTDIRDRFKALVLAQESWADERAKVLGHMKRQTAKVETLIEVFAAFLTLTSEADKSTQKRVRLMISVLRQTLEQHDKQPQPKSGITVTHLAFLALGSIFAIIGVVEAMGWVF